MTTEDLGRKLINTALEETPIGDSVEIIKVNCFNRRFAIDLFDRPWLKLLKITVSIPLKLLKLTVSILLKLLKLTVLMPFFRNF